MNENSTSIGATNRNRIAAVDAASGVVTSWYPSPGTNGLIGSIVVSQGTVYVGGGFTEIGLIPRDWIAAEDTTTGAVTSRNPGADGIVSTLAVSGSVVYAGGDFTSIGGAGRNRLAALDVTSGLARDWDPNANNLVLALAAGGGRVYAGGAFNLIGGLQRRNLAAFEPLELVSVPWTPDAPSSIALALAPNPATDRLTLQFTMRSAGRASVEVFDVRGSRVKTIGGGTFIAGAHRLTWDGRDRHGRPVSAGIYLVRLITDQGGATKRVSWMASP